MATVAGFTVDGYEGTLQPPQGSSAARRKPQESQYTSTAVVADDAAAMTTMANYRAAIGSTVTQDGIAGVFVADCLVDQREVNSGVALDARWILVAPRSGL